MSPIRYDILALSLVVLSSPPSHADGSPGTLALVHVMYRHGDRTPVAPYPTDPYRNLSNWPVSWGQLTNLGKEQQLELGQWLRNRYAGFLPETFSPDDIYVQSTDCDRTLMSAESNLAGLYPPSDSEMWHMGLKWQPIPVHTVPEQYDHLLGTKAPCPRYDKELSKVMNSPSMQELNKKNADLYKYLSEKSGVNIKDVISVEYLYNTLFIENLYNMSLPEWTHPVFPDKMKPLVDYSFRLAAYTPVLKRLRSGSLVKEMVTHMREAMNGSLSPPRKMFMYSAHDTTIANLLMTLNVFDSQCPPYTALVLIELWKNKQQKYVVTVSFRNTSLHAPYVMTLPGCQPVCPFEKFVELTKPIIPLNLEEECKVKNRSDEFQLSSVAVLTLSSSVFLALMLFVSIIFSVMYWKKQRSTSYYYHQIHTEGH